MHKTHQILLPQSIQWKSIVSEYIMMIYECYIIDVNVNGKEIVLSFCKTCNIKRPPRTFHCSRCEACIEVHGKQNQNLWLSLIHLDHHCPWVGTCVGKRNHKFFALFIFYISLHAGFTVATGLVTIVKGYTMYINGAPMMINFPCWVITVFAIMMFFTLFPFSQYHLWLLARGRTTNEEVRGKYN